MGIPNISDRQLAKPFLVNLNLIVKEGRVQYDEYENDQERIWMSEASEA